MLIDVFQILLILITPYYLIRLTYHFKTEKILSPVVLCYGFGILLSHLPFLGFNDAIAQQASKITILLAIPLLMFSTDLKAWFGNARSTILSFFLCVFSGVFLSILMALILQGYIAEIWIPTGMLTGIFTGSAPNLNAVGIALNAPNEMMVYLNATDIICGGLLLIFLTSVAHRLYGLFLPSFTPPLNSGAEINKISEPQNIKPNYIKKHYQPLGLSLLLAILILVLSVGITFSITGALNSQSIVILSLTTLSVIISFSPRIRNLEGSYELGEYLLYIFCIAIGLMADFSMIFQEGGYLLVLTAGIMYGTLIFHLVLAWIFKIDRDTVLITSTAALYGPAFVGQIASTIQNRQLLFSGMATGLVGYAIGNFLGIGVAEFLEWYLESW